MVDIVDRDIALEWYQYGLEKGDDFFIKFMMHWVAFNWLYNQCKGVAEWERISNFCNDNIERLQKYDAFSSTAYTIFAHGPIKNERIGSNTGVTKRRYREMKDNHSIPDLICTLYQVRCNLFHGSKSLRIDRDIQIVEAS